MQLFLAMVLTYRYCCIHRTSTWLYLNRLNLYSDKLDATLCTKIAAFAISVSCGNQIGNLFSKRVRIFWKGKTVNNHHCLPYWLFHELGVVVCHHLPFPPFTCFWIKLLCHHFVDQSRIEEGCQKFHEHCSYSRGSASSTDNLSPTRWSLLWWH